MAATRLDTGTAHSLTRESGSSRAQMLSAAQALESQFAQMMIKSMRSTSMGNSLFPGENSTFRDMHDQRLAQEMTKGRGLGLAPLIMRQLEASQPGGAVIPAGPTSPLPLNPALGGGALPLAQTRSGLSLQAMPSSLLPPQLRQAVADVASQAATEVDDAGPVDGSSPERFVASIWPHAQRTARELGVPAKALVAQAALETGWGRRLVGGRGGQSHNLFGIKATGWNGRSVDSGTHEYVNGTRVNQRDRFRAYGSAAESFADYARLLGRPRYAAARGNADVRGFASALQQAGYATDPAYANKITAIAEGGTMQRALARIGVEAGA